jgi:hypothetical protein
MKNIFVLTYCYSDRRSFCARRLLHQILGGISHHVWRPPEGRGFSPGKIAAPLVCRPRAARRLRLQAARGTGHGNGKESLVTAGLKPRPSYSAVRNPG